MPEVGGVAVDFTLFSRIQLIASASFWKRLSETLAKVLMLRGLDPAEDAVLWLMVASGRDRKTACASSCPCYGV